MGKQEELRDLAADIAQRDSVLAGMSQFCVDRAREKQEHSKSKLEQ